MTITNHLLAGSVIALTIKHPVMALPLAYTSHFLMDAMPHFGYPGGTNFKEAVKIASQYRLTYFFSLFSAATFIGVLIYLALNNLWFALACGFLSVAPDGIMFLNYLVFERKGRRPKGPKIYLYLNLQFHGKVQNEKPKYIYFEILTFILLLCVLYKII